jgi:PEP-CTERM motif
MLFPKLKYIAAVLVLVTSSDAFGAIVLTPPDLQPGQKYRLAFVSSGSTQALSTSIADYNAFVSAQALANPELNTITTWTAIGSTFTSDARDNTGTNPNNAVGVPIYRLDGIRIANDNADLWDGQLLANLSITQFGTSSNQLAWTGSLPGGIGFPTSELGQSFISIGDSVGAGTGWISNGFANPAVISASMYAISGELTAVPEPSSTILVGIGTCGWLLVRRRLKKNS